MRFRKVTKGRLRAWAAGAAVVALTSLSSGCAGQSYSCGGPNGNHCYGTVSWSGSYTGLSMQLTTVSLTSGDVSVDDEAWLIDNTRTPVNWIETGETNENVAYYGGDGTTNYFWAYGVDGESMNVYLGPVSQSDLNNSAWIAYRINQDPTVPSTWNVNIWEAATGTMLYNESVADYPMSPNTVIEGQELAGSKGAVAPFAFFAQNAFFQTGKMSFQTSDGTVCMGPSPACSGPPPHANWWPGAKASQTSNGGMFFTWCC
jgi:hypothetical protein